MDGWINPSTNKEQGRVSGQKGGDAQQMTPGVLDVLGGRRELAPAEEVEDDLVGPVLVAAPQGRWPADSGAHVIMKREKRVVRKKGRRPSHNPAITQCPFIIHAPREVDEGSSRSQGALHVHRHAALGARAVHLPLRIGGIR